MKNGKRILEVKIKHMIDESPDTSWLGEYSDRAETEFAIDRATDEFVYDANRGLELLEDAEDYLAEQWNEYVSDDCPAHLHTDWWATSLDAAMNTLRDMREEWETSLNWNRREYRYFNPGTVEPFKADASWIPNHLTDPIVREIYWHDAMRKNALQDYERMEKLNAGYFHFMGIRADAEVAIGMTVQTITSGGLWGIESDSEKSYIQETEQEQLSELRSQLKELGFSSRAISAAFKNVTREEN